MTGSMGQESAVPDSQDLTGHADDAGVAGNERLTALAGAILLVLILIELVSVVWLRALMSVHVAVGILLALPLTVKLASTGYRLVRYYTGSRPYVKRGPPSLPLRLLAPVLVAVTLILVGSGIGLVAVGPNDRGPMLPLHNVSALLWLPLIVIHTVAYILRVPRLAGPDLVRAAPTAGRTLRLTASIGSLVLGAVGALVLLPAAAPWVAWSQATHQVPAPLLVGTVLSVLVLVAVRPLRWR